MKLRSFALHPDSFLLFEPVCEYTVLFMVLGVVKMEPCHGQQCFVEIQLLCRHLPTGVQALCTWKRAALWCRLEMRTLPVPRRCQGCDLRATESSKAEFSRAKYWKKMIQSNPRTHIHITFTSHSHHIHITFTSHFTSHSHHIHITFTSHSHHISHHIHITFTSHSHHIKHFWKTAHCNSLAFSSIVTGHFRRAGCFFLTLAPFFEFVLVF